MDLTWLLVMVVIFLPTLFVVACYAGLGYVVLRVVRRVLNGPTGR